MIDKKKVIMENVSIKQTFNHKNIEIETTTTVKTQESTIRKSYTGASSMMQFMKNAVASGGNLTSSGAAKRSNKAFLFTKAEKPVVPSINIKQHPGGLFNTGK